MISSQRKTLVLIDAHAVLHRAFHALPNFTSPKGEPTGALYGFTAFLLKIIRELKPDYLVACYDLPEPTFRHIAYENYKAKRPKMDEVLACQINRSRDILKAFNIPIYDSSGFEADDIIGTVVEQIKKIQDSRFKIQVVIASGDLDTLQLVRNDDVVVYTLRKGVQDTIIYNEDKVKERFGFPPQLIPDFKGLTGDPSDNIIGVRGIGEKTASRLIKKFGTIESLYEKTKKDKEILEKEGIKPKTIQLLKDNEEEALFSKTLAEIRRDAPINFSLENTAWKDSIDTEKIKILFKEFGFKSLLERLPSSHSKKDIEKEDSNQIIFEKIKDQVPEELFYEVELPLSKILKEISERGILLDVEYLKKISKEYHEKLKTLESKIWSLAGEKFNINSPKQLCEILFNKLQIKTKGIRKTGTGNQSTNISELIKLKGEHPIIEEIISYREFAKLISTYVDNLPKLVGKDGRLHTVFDQFGTATGRISSKDPNLQNIPKRTGLGKNIRRAFIADKGFVLADFDYSQIELRITAILSDDSKLKKIFEKDEDIHSAVASEIFKVPLEKATEEMRRVAKIINFGIIYGMGINTLRANIGCSREEAQAFYEEYFNDFKGVADYLEKTKEEVRRKGCTETLFGRKRYFPEINSPIEYIKKETERMAINAPIQGSAADFIKLAMVRVDKVLTERNLKDRVKLLLQIHDELLFEIEEGVLAETIPLIKEAMEGVYKHHIPIKVNISLGKNWQDMVKCKHGKGFDSYN